MVLTYYTVLGIIIHLGMFIIAMMPHAKCAIMGIAYYTVLEIIVHQSMFIIMCYNGHIKKLYFISVNKAIFKVLVEVL